MVLDRPVVGEKREECTDQAISASSSCRVMNILSSFTYPSSIHLSLDQEVAYVTPLLAFNLGLHVSCLKLLVHGGQESLKSLFEAEGHGTDERRTNNSSMHIELDAWPHLPKYASHLRVSFVKIPECGTLGSLRGNSTIEVGDRQDIIDSALNAYFKVDRFLARGDVFCIHINWYCGSEMCVACNQNMLKRFSSNRIYFKVCFVFFLNNPSVR